MTLEVHLEELDFTGPLDLLLKLVRRNEMDLAQINVSEICDQFVEYVDAHRLAELEEGYSFLVLASTLLEIKSRLMLPSTDGELLPEGDEAPTPEEMTAELLVRLRVYENFRNIAAKFEMRMEEMSRFIPGGAERGFEDQLVLSLSDLSLYDLMNTFQKVVSERQREGIEISDEARPIEEAIEELLSDPFIAGAGRRLSDLLLAQPTLLDLVVMFLAILELISDGKLDFVSTEGEVLLMRG